jgi:hypothetical protein
VSQLTVPSLGSLPVRADFAEGSIDEIALAHNRDYIARVFPQHRDLYMRGWALDTAARSLVSGVRILIDGSHEFSATYGHTRADIATVFGSPDLGACGFEITLPPIIGPGDHSVEAYAISWSGKDCFCFASLTLHVVSTLVPRAFDRHLAGSTLGDIEHFANDDDQRTMYERAGIFDVSNRGGCIISGWAFDRKNRATLVEVGALVDARWYVQGNPGIERRDVSDAYGFPSIPGWGFRARFALNFVDPGMHSVQIVGRIPTGEWVSVGKARDFEVIAPPLPWIWALTKLQQPTVWELTGLQFYARALRKKPRKLPDPLPVVPEGAIALSGWAIDRPAITAASAVYISVDGDRRNPITARYGLPTPELSARIGPGPWAACGFNALLPAKGLEYGDHTVELLIVSSSGSGYYPVDAFRFNLPCPDKQPASELARAPVLVHIYSPHGDMQVTGLPD